MSTDASTSLTRAAANDDDDPGHPCLKRTYKRHKRWKDDLRTNTLTRVIAFEDYWEGRTAWRQAWNRGLGLDCMVTVWPMDFAFFTPEVRWEKTRQLMKQVRAFHASNDNLPQIYAYMLSREARGEDGSGEHIHWLMNTNGHQSEVARYFEKKFPAHGEVKIEIADGEWRRLSDGKFGNAATYLMKACDRSVWQHDSFAPYRKSGPVFGPRILWSTTINETQPRHRIPRKTRRFASRP